MVRYVLHAPTIWQVEIAVYLLIAATFLGAPYGLKQNAHINIDILVVFLPERVRNWLDIVTSFVAMLFCVFLAWRGCVMWWEAFEGGWKSSSLFIRPSHLPLCATSSGDDSHFPAVHHPTHGHAKEDGKPGGEPSERQKH